MSLIEPYCGTLCELLEPESEREALRQHALSLPCHVLTPKQLCDLELLINGGFSPLTGFLNEADYNSVVQNMRLSSGQIWPMPITLDISDELKSKISVGKELALRSAEGFLVAVLEVQSLWVPNREREAELVFGTTNTEHPGVFKLLKQSQPNYVGGRIRGLELPKHYDFAHLRRTPRQVRELLSSLGATKVVAFQTRNPMHRAHVELTLRAAKESGAHLLIHPVVGVTKPGDVDYFTRVRCYEKTLKYLPQDQVTLSVLPLAMRMGGPREAVWHSIIRRNFGASHFIVGRDHAGPGKDSSGKPFYGIFEAQELLTKLAPEIGITVAPFKSMVYVAELDKYVPDNEVPAGVKPLEISGTQLRRLLDTGGEIPAWLSFPDVIEELRRSYPANYKKGFTLFLTGLPSSGKSTLANALAIKLQEMGGRSISLLDGDIVRTFLSTELGFSREHRAIQVKRVGFVASEIIRHGGIAICALIAPYKEDRDYNRKMISESGRYVEVYVSTDLSECEKRDPKGLYAKARKGLAKGVTGIDDPYEAPSNAELALDMGKLSVEEGIEAVLGYLKSEGFIV